MPAVDSLQGSPQLLHGLHCHLTLPCSLHLIMSQSNRTAALGSRTQAHKLLQLQHAWKQIIDMWVQDRDVGEDDKQFKLSRFMPVLQEVLEDLANNSLPEHEYPYVSAPTSNGGAPRPHSPPALSPRCLLFGGIV